MNKFKVGDKVKVVEGGYLWQEYQLPVPLETVLTVVEDDIDTDYYCSKESMTIELDGVNSSPASFELVQDDFDYLDIKGDIAQKITSKTIEKVYEPLCSAPFECEVSSESLNAFADQLGVARPILSERKVGKVRIDLFDHGFPLAIQEIAKVLTWAKENKGYKDHDWANIPDPEVCFSGAASRHRLKHNIQRQVEQLEMLRCVDDESNIMHLTHQATNVLMELELALRGVIK